VVADIPGLIEGAHLGHGLGIQFLRILNGHDYCFTLWTSRQPRIAIPLTDFKIIEKELAEHNPTCRRSPGLSSQPSWMLPTRKLRKLQQWCRQRRIELIRISSVTGEGLEELKHGIIRKLSSETPGES
jgi:GTP-binding protein